MSTNIYYGKYGCQRNIRDDFKHMPLQRFWTWVTGKGSPLAGDELEKVKQTGSTSYLVLHLFYTWILYFICSVLIYYALNIWECEKFISLFIIALSEIIIVNRMRSLQATFHYMTHGSTTDNYKLAKITATTIITTPMLYIDWGRYIKSHVSHHHHPNVLCTDGDPDQIFIRAQGFYRGMPEWKFWFFSLLTSFKPSYLFGEIKESLTESLILGSAFRKIFGLFFWIPIIAVVILYEQYVLFFLVYLLPRFVIFPHSMWLQLITEHLWFSTPKNDNETKDVHYRKLTWGRFQGRPIPSGVMSKLLWVIKLLFIDVFVRLYIYPQDLPNHDFHHRSPKTNYRYIADIRATMELNDSDSKLGKYYEVWGFFSTLRILRDHICYKNENLFISNNDV